MFQFRGNFGFEFMNHLILHFKHVIKWKNNNNKIHVFLFSHKTHFEYLNHRFSCNSRLFVKYTCKVNLMEDFWFSMPKFLYSMNSMTTRTLSIWSPFYQFTMNIIYKKYCTKVSDSQNTDSYISWTFILDQVKGISSFKGLRTLDTSDFYIRYPISLPTITTTHMHIIYYIRKLMTFNCQLQFYAPSSDAKLLQRTLFFWSNSLKRGKCYLLDER